MPVQNISLASLNVAQNSITPPLVDTSAPRRNGSRGLVPDPQTVLSFVATVCMSRSIMMILVTSRAYTRPHNHDAWVA